MPIMPKSSTQMLLICLVVGAAILAAGTLYNRQSAAANPEESMITPKLSPEELSTYDVAYFAGGCFWCIEAAFQPLEGVAEAVSGYMGGTTPDPTYEAVASGQTDHVEAVKVYFDPEVSSYTELVEQFWRNIDPTDAGGQFADRGSTYQTAIFYATEEQKAIAEASKEALEASGKFEAPIVTPILPATPFYEAEEYHQDYFIKQTTRYERYKEGSGRAGFIDRVWKQE